jgi:hypothetical protein
MERWQDMSEEKTPKKESKKVEKKEKKEAVAPSNASDKAADGSSKSATDASADKSSDASSDKTADKTPAPNKSASQTSISHFSSVATKEYRSGWAAIFGSNQSQKKTSTKGAKGISLPVHLEIQDQDIKDDLRSLLYKAFQRQARREGISLAECKKLGAISYNLECNVIDD